MYCPNCGTIVNDLQSFCTHCGKRLQSVKTPQEYYTLGECYYFGTDEYSVDYPKAFACYKTAADAGHVDAIYSIGYMHLNGDGMEVNIPLAIQWFQYALQRDPQHGMSYYHLGRIYYLGEGIRANYDLALDYFTRETHCNIDDEFMGHTFCFIGCILFSEKKRPRESIQYFIDAIGKHAEIDVAWNNLGLLCELGHYHPQNGMTPMDFYKKAAALGSVESMEAVGKLYLKQALNTSGAQQIQAKEQAAKWLRMAANHGSKSARIGLFSASVSWTSDSSTYTAVTTPSPVSSENESKSFLFTDGRGNLCQSGNAFYDFQGNYCAWGNPFYDSKGYLCVPGNCFHDGKGNYCRWGDPFYDAKGNYIVP